MERGALGNLVCVALRQTLVSLATVLLLVACFDVESVETNETRILWPEVQRVDDFENVDRWPLWERLGPWDCFANPEAASCYCNDSSSSRFGLPYHAAALEFELENEEGWGAVLQSVAREDTGPLDLSGYDELVFTAELQQVSEGSLPSQVELRVGLQCEGAVAVGISPDGVPLMVQGAVTLSPGAPRQRYALELQRLRQPQWEYGELGLERVDPSACLRNVSTLRLEVPGTLEQSLAGRLILDDIELYDFPDADVPARGAAYLSPWDFCLTTEGGIQKSCAGTNRGPTMTFALEDQPGLDEERGAWLCTNVVRLNPTSHELEDASLDLARYRLLRFEAKLTGATVPPRLRERILVSLQCSKYSGTGFAYVGREIAVEADWSSYALPLETFEVGAYPQQFDDQLGCLGHVETLCMGGDLEDGESAAGTLRVREISVE